MLGKKALIVITGILMVAAFSCQNPHNRRYKGTRGEKVKHHHGFFTVNDRATRRNEKFKRKTSKAGDSKKTSAKTVKKAKTKSRTTYVKTFDHH